MLLLIAFLLLVLGGYLFYLFSKKEAQDLLWQKWNFSYLDEIHNTRTFDVPDYEFIKITDQYLGMWNRFFLYPESDWHSSEISDNPHYWTQESRLFYNNEKKLFGVGSSFGIGWIFFNAEGDIIENIPEDEQPPGNHQSWEMVSGLGNYYRFDDQEADIYVAYFSKERYNWSRHNPLANLGSPTAGHGSYWWWFGNAYLKVQLEKGIFVFKTEGQMDGSTSNTPRYKVLIDYYKIPKELTNGKEVVLIYQDESFENMDYGLFMIKEK